MEIQVGVDVDVRTRAWATLQLRKKVLLRSTRAGRQEVTLVGRC